MNKESRGVGKGSYGIKKDFIAIFTYSNPLLFFLDGGCSNDESFRLAVDGKPDVLRKLGLMIFWKIVFLHDHPWHSNSVNIYKRNNVRNLK